MILQLKFNSLKVLLAVFLILTGCNGFKSKNMEDLASKFYSDCALGVATSASEPCLVENKYVYNSSFGGRNTTGSNITLAEGQLSGTVPSGWYSGKTVGLQDADLVSSNIVSGVQIFGVTGDLTANASVTNCSASGFQSATCTGTVGNYYYDGVYGGRTVACSVGAATTEACWLSESSPQYISRSAATDCTVIGLLSGQCNILSGRYWYTSAYGGRAATCSNGTNTTACWISSSNMMVSDSACVDEQVNSTACVTNTNRYIYTTAYGGRQVNCSDNSAGNCWFSTGTKSGVATELLAGNIKNGVTIFGVTGTFTGTSLTWASAAHRTKATTQITFTSEKGQTADLPTGYSSIPNISTDNDGGVVNTEISLVDRTTWGTTTCGTSGSLSARISECSTAFANATWDGSTMGNAGQSLWRLVSRSGNLASGMGQEVWRDTQTGLLWSSLVSTNLNWCKASGSSNSANSNVSSQILNEDDPSDICDQQLYQNQLSTESVISACAEFTGFTNTGADITASGRAGLSLSSSPKVAWRLPSMYDYAVANKHGLRFVLPDAGPSASGFEWTATINSQNRSEAYLFNSKNGSKSKQNRMYLNSVRCVGR